MLQSDTRAGPDLLLFCLRITCPKVRRQRQLRSKALHLGDRLHLEAIMLQSGTRAGLDPILVCLHISFPSVRKRTHALMRDASAPPRALTGAEPASQAANGHAAARSGAAWPRIFLAGALTDCAPAVCTFGTAAQCRGRDWRSRVVPAQGPSMVAESLRGWLLSAGGAAAQRRGRAAAEGRAARLPHARGLSAQPGLHPGRAECVPALHVHTWRKRMPS